MGTTIIKTILIFAIFLITVFGINTIAENGILVQVSEVVTKRYLTPATAIAIAIITVAFDVCMIYLFMVV